MLTSTNSLNIGSFFKHKQIHKMTWVSPDGVTQNELDYISTSTMWRLSLLDSRSDRGADVGLDHHQIKAEEGAEGEKALMQWTS